LTQLSKYAMTAHAARESIGIAGKRQQYFDMRFLDVKYLDIKYTCLFWILARSARYARAIHAIFRCLCFL